MIYETEFVQGFKQDDYQPPRTIRTRVQTEGGFCGSVVEEKDTKKYKATGHELGDEYDFGSESEKNDFWN